MTGYHGELRTTLALLPLLACVSANTKTSDGPGVMPPVDGAAVPDAAADRAAGAEAGMPDGGVDAALAADGAADRAPGAEAGAPDVARDVAPPDAPPPMFKLTLASFGVAGTMGTLTPNPPGTTCGAGCVSYPQGQTVTIAAGGMSGALFAAWAGDCAGMSASCALTMNADHTATAHFRPASNIMFVTSKEIALASIGPSLATADKFCADAAKAAFLGGTVWRAWLSTSGSTTNISAAAHVGASTTGWIRSDGRPFASSMADLLAGKVLYPPRLTEAGTDRREFYAVATATLPDGTLNAGESCSDWSSATGSVAVGDASTTTDDWTQGFIVGGNSCASAYPVYCFENDPGMAAVVVPAIPADGRRAFVSKTAWTPGGGIAAADALCQADATAANLPTPANYRALLSTTAPALDAARFNVSGQPWYRLDGVQIAATAADLAAPAGDKLLAPLNVTSAGAYVSGIVWTGSGVSPGSATNTTNCSGWMAGDSGTTGWFGFTNVTRLYNAQALFWANNTQACNTPDPVYCLER